MIHSRVSVLGTVTERRSSAGPMLKRDRDCSAQEWSILIPTNDLLTTGHQRDQPRRPVDNHSVCRAEALDDHLLWSQ
jgi:hypothetical protein